MLSHNDIRSLYAIILTRALPHADRWDAENTDRPQPFGA